MSIKLELNGIVYQKGEPTTRNNYTNQDMILHIPDLEKENYSDFFKIEWNDKGIEKAEKENSADQELTPFPILDTPEKETKNDLPF